MARQPQVVPRLSIARRVAVVVACVVGAALLAVFIIRLIGDAAGTDVVRDVLGVEVLLLLIALSLLSMLSLIATQPRAKQRGHRRDGPR